LPSSSKGWYVDLPDEGERIVQNAQIDGSFLVTASQMPSGNSCDDVGGSGYINALTPFAGIASGKSYFDLDGDGNTDDTGTSGKPTGSVKTNGMPTLPVLLPGQIIINTSGGVTQKLNKGQALWNRVSWREIRSD
jgi:type IV pilus assembly protein PilY1